MSSDGVGRPDPRQDTPTVGADTATPAPPQQSLPEQGAPEQSAREQGSPGQAATGQGLPGQGFPGQGSRDEQGLPGQGSPSAQWPEQPGADLPGLAEYQARWPPTVVPRKRRTKLVVGIVLAVLVVAGAAVGLSALLNSRNSDRYAVGVCVTRHDGEARVVSCGTKGAFRITKQVPDRARCPRPNGPALRLDGAPGDRYRCLSPVNGS